MTRMPRRARAVAIAEARNANAYLSLKVFIIAACATAAFIALPSLGLF